MVFKKELSDNMKVPVLYDTFFKRYFLKKSTNKFSLKNVKKLFFFQIFVQSVGTFLIPFTTSGE